MKNCSFLYHVCKKTIILGLLLQLSSSSFLATFGLTSWKTHQKITKPLLDYTVKNQNLSFMKFALKQETEGSLNWRTLLATMAKIDADSAYQLASFYKSNFDNHKALLWFKQAARLNHHGAKIQWALLTLKMNDNSETSFNEAMLALDLIPSNSSSLSEDVPVSIQRQKAIIILKIMVSKGDMKSFNSLLLQDLSLLLSHEEGQMLLEEFKLFNLDYFYSLEVQKNLLTPKKHVIRATQFSTDSMEAEQGAVVHLKNCLADIQLFATNIKDLYQTQKLIEDFNTSLLSEHVCLPPVRYIPLPELNCHQEKLYTRQDTLQCDESSWHQYAQTIKTKYIAVVIPQTSSHVNLGILYLKSGENSQGFSHEITHLLGFIDEYPIPAQHSKCQKAQERPFSLNIAVLKKSYDGDIKALRKKVLSHIPWGENVKDTTPIFVEKYNIKNKEKMVKDNYWQLGTPDNYRDEIGVFITKTCDNSPIRQIAAFKPVFSLTHLNYSSLELPKEYLKLLTQYGNEFQMPSYEYNIALSYLYQGMHKNAKYWLNKAAFHEDSSIKKQRILEARF
jgi:tetratricopeptide (TPR) repeat protein